MAAQNYKAAIYTVETTVAKTPGEVFSLMIDLKKWWPEDMDGSELLPGVEFDLSVGEEHYSKNRVTDFESGKRFAWVVTDSIRRADGFQWTGTKIIFELIPDSINTIIKFTYDGVILEQEADKLTLICDMAIKDLLYNYITYGKTKRDFSVTIEVKKTAAEVFKALTEGVVKWWGGPDLSGYTTRLNDEFVIHHPGAHYSKQKIVELVPNERLVWLVTESELTWLKQDKQEWTNTKLIFEITNDDDETRLRFTHVGLTPGKECYDACTRTGWDIVIKDYLYQYIVEHRPHFS